MPIDEHRNLVIPSFVNCGLNDYEPFFHLLQKDRPAHEITLDFSQCQNIDALGMISLLGVTKLWRKDHASVNIGPTIRESLRDDLERFRFLDHYRLPTSEGESADQHSELPPHEYRCFTPLRPFNGHRGSVMQYLSDFWLKPQLLSQNLSYKSHLLSMVWEVFNNAKVHSRSAIDTYACGQFWAEGSHDVDRPELTLVIADFGIGIPGTVRDRFNRPDYDSVDALKWALEKKNTTRVDKLSRYSGQGLKILVDFLAMTTGSLHIISLDARCRIGGSKSDIMVEKLAAKFPGTIVEIRVPCEELYYQSARQAVPKEAIF